MKLDDICIWIDDHTKKYSGPPISRRKKWRRTSLRRQTKKKLDRSLPQTVCTEESDETVSAAERELNRMWSNPPNDVTVLQVGPYNITHRSFHYLKTSLSDEIMDAYLSLMTKEKNILHISCVVATAIFYGEGNLHQYLSKENFNTYDACIAAANEGGFHWVLFIIVPEEKSLVYINPMGELRSVCNQLQQSWCNFLDERNEFGFGESSSGWNLRTLEHSKQFDSLSCGIYVLKFAENYLQKKSLMLHWSRNDITKERTKIAIRLMECGSETLSSTELPAAFEDETCVPPSDTDQDVITKVQKQKGYYLRKHTKKKHSSSWIFPVQRKTARKSPVSFCICNQPEDDRIYWHCEVCLGWYHPQCMNIPVEDEPEHFICLACREKEQDIQDTEDTTIYITDTFCYQNFAEVVKHLHSIMECEDLHCEEPAHQRHHIYCKHPIKFYNEARQLHCFGAEVFSQQTIQNFGEKLSSELVYHHKDAERPYSCRYRQIRNLKSSELQSIFTRYAL